ncbi:MAG: hypothetical protein FJ137_18870, partial [Deltaproteobacteria bacterium]|nr:hypothetical protein [Deltaproteobacteria bacterium]
MLARSAFALLLLWSTASSAANVFDLLTPQPKEKPKVRPDEAAKKRGLDLKKSVEADLDGDGKKDVVGVALGQEGLQLVVFGEDAAGAVVAQVLPPVGGRELATLEARALAPPAASTEVVLEAYDETPDEKFKRIRVYGHHGDRVVELFTNVIHRAKNADARDEVDRDKSIIAYGEARAGWSFADVDDDGSIEVLVRRKPQILRLKKDDGAEVKLLTGVREEVWRFDADRTAFTSAGERLNDFLPAHDVVAVKGSSAWIEPAELKELKAAALHNALLGGDKGAEQARGGELGLGLEDLEAPGAGEGKADKKVKKKSDKKAERPSEPRAKTKPKAEAEPPPPELEIDRGPYFLRATDRNLSTGWVEDDAKGDGDGEWIELELDEAAPIHMVRVVGGCVDTQATFRDFNVPETFKLSLDGGETA